MAEPEAGMASMPAADTEAEAGRKRLERRIALSRLFLGFEALWPRLWWVFAVILTFLTVSWMGAWEGQPPAVRMGGVALFGLMLLASLVIVARWRWPARRAAIDRLDATSGEGHRPAATLDDQLSVGAEDAFARTVWRLHRERQQLSADRLRALPPRPRMAQKDLRALRLAPVFAAVAALFVAGPEVEGRLASAFAWHLPGLAPAPMRIDAWLDPPAYTRLPPVLIDLAKPQGEGLRAPVNSVLVVRVVSGKGGVPPQIVTQGGLKAVEAEKPAASAEAAPVNAPAATADGVREQRYQLTGDARLSIRQGGSGGAGLSLIAIPDRAPEIQFVESPTSNNRGGMSFVYRARDDYGLASVEAAFEPSAAAPGAVPLIDPPTVALTPPVSPTGEEDTKASAELADHPWAGARVKVKLIARDEAGQSGESDSRELTLPQRSFSNPLAKALVEQRRKLILDMGARGQVQTALDALMIAPDVFMPEKGKYLSLRLIVDGLRRARGKPALVEVADSLWAFALHLEDDGVSDAERELRAAQERMQQALDRGASEQEIKRLTDELRRAMDRYMRDFAQRMEKEMRESGRDVARLPENMRTITPRDLRQMLDRIEELARRGDTAEAQRLLDQLKEIMRNLQMAKPGQRDPGSQQRNQAMNELDQMTRDQQALRDETFQDEERRRNGETTRPPRRPGQQQARPNQRGQQQGQQQQGQRQRGQQQPGEAQPGEGDDDQDMAEGGQPGEGQRQAQSPRSLKDRQQALRDRLQQLQRKMQELGMPNEQGLGEAEQAMGEAEQALGQEGGEGNAVDAQGRALDALKKGAQNLAQQMQQGDQDGDGDGTENADGGMDPNGSQRADGRSSQQGNEDPLGRPQRNRDWSNNNVKVPGADESAAQRARRVLDELRRRLSESGRAQDEIDYLERLLRRN